jgi:hypothetical protein
LATLFSTKKNCNDAIRWKNYSPGVIIAALDGVDLLAA